MEVCLLVKVCILHPLYILFTGYSIDNSGLDGKREKKNLAIVSLFTFDVLMEGASLMLKLTMPSSMHMVELVNGDGQ